MTGLNPDSDRIIEMAMVVTNSEPRRDRRGAGGSCISPTRCSAAWTSGTEYPRPLRACPARQGFDHRRGRGRAAGLEFLALHAERAARTSPMCGNSICQDRRFMARYMPKLEDWFHYRNLDVSRSRSCASAGSRKWQGPEEARPPRGAGRHPRVDRRVEVLPRAFPENLASRGGTAASARSCRRDARFRAPGSSPADPFRCRYRSARSGAGIPSTCCRPSCGFR
jgi:oligoribonuclease